MQACELPGQGKEDTSEKCSWSGQPHQILKAGCQPDKKGLGGGNQAAGRDNMAGGKKKKATCSGWSK